MKRKDERVQQVNEVPSPLNPCVHVLRVCVRACVRACMVCVRADAHACMDMRKYWLGAVLG